MAQIEVLAQDFDLIVTTDGDSIACRIESSSKTHVYFQMRKTYEWVHSVLSIDDIVVFERDAINWKSYQYQQGTSIIDPEKSRVHSALSMRDSRRNSVFVSGAAYLLGDGDYYFTMDANFDRIFPLFDRFGLVLGAGYGLISYDDLELTAVLRGSILTGGPYHFFEAGPDFYFVDLEDYLSIRLGYRYQSEEGFTFKLSVKFSAALAIGLELSCGYSL